MLKLYYTGLLPRGSVEVSFDNGNSYVEKTLAELKEGLDIGNADTADIKIKVANANTDDLVAGSQLEIGENEIVIKNVDIKQDTVKIEGEDIPKSSLSETSGLYYFEGEDGDGYLNFGETAYWSDSRGALRKAEFTEIGETGHYTSNFDNKVYNTNNGIAIASGHSLAEGFTGYSIDDDNYFVLDKNNETVDTSFQTFVSVGGNNYSKGYFEDDEKEPLFFEYSSGSWTSGRAQDASYVEGAKELDWASSNNSFYAYFTKDENGFNNIEFTSTDLTPAEEGADRVYESNYNEDYYFEGNSSGQIINSYPKSEYVDPNAEEESN